MRLFIVLWSSWLLSAAPAFAIDEGVIDGARHPNVGWTGVDFDGGGPEPPSPWCTGSVISDHAILTAGHCVAGLPGETEFFVTLAAGTPAAPLTPPGLYPDEFPFTFNVPIVKAQTAVLHPGFDPASRAHDLAVLVFGPGTFAGVAPVDLPAKGQLARVPRRPFRLVGYGADPEYGDGVPQLIIEGYRQTRVTSFRRLTPTQLELDRGGCEGDSGSPQLLGNLAVSVLSDAGEACRGPVRGQRLDTREEIKFLRRYL